MRRAARTAVAAVLAFAAAAACSSQPDPGPRPATEDTRAVAEERPEGPLSEEQFAALHRLSSEPAPAPRGRDVDLPGAGSRAYLSLPEERAAPMPGVLVIHEFWGLNDHVRHYADRLAADGYAALAVDLYEGKVAAKREDAQAFMKSVDAARAHAVLAAAHRFLVEDPRVRAPRTAVMGWCFGGKWTLETALVQPELDAAVMYYGQPVTDRERLKTLACPLLGIFGTRDASIPVEKVREFDAALTSLGKPHEIRLFDAEHAFANPSGGRYSAGPAAEAWAATREFLASRLR